MRSIFPAALFLPVVLVLGSGAARAQEPPPGAAACSGCHPASRWVATPVPRLDARPARAIVTAMQEFRSGKRPATVMHKIARGFSDSEISAIAAWYAARKESQ
jgi:cytochrome subunit of sulfide dehydrogenase